MTNFVKNLIIQSSIVNRPTFDLEDLVNSEGYFLSEFRDLIIFKGVSKKELKYAIIKELKVRGDFREFIEILLKAFVFVILCVLVLKLVFVGVVG